jgi:hypothetical protein
MVVPAAELLAQAALHLEEHLIIAAEAAALLVAKIQLVMPVVQAFHQVLLEVYIILVAAVVVAAVVVVLHSLVEQAERAAAVPVDTRMEGLGQIATLLRDHAPLHFVLQGLQARQTLAVVVAAHMLWAAEETVVLVS